MSDLLLTLGHNASAIAISVGDDGAAKVENAYELERLTGKKSDSAFPIDAIIALKERGMDKIDRVYVSHWSPTGRVDDLKAKYWDRSIFPPHVPVITQESMNLTHHDCHAQAAMAFAGSSFPTKDTGVLVVDGFGNLAEHLSYYRVQAGGQLHLMRRWYGYGTSLGLMYQYATSFLGLKMHEDEYKLLGYGARVATIGCDMDVLNQRIFTEAQAFLKRFRSLNSFEMSPDLAGLPAVQEKWAERFAAILDDVGFKGSSSTYEARCIVGYAVQQLLEIVIRNLFMADLPKPTNLIVTGGVAFNVELNRMLLGLIPGKLCVMPLAGDQGNALGLWAFSNRRAKLDFGDLCWGRREMTLGEPGPDTPLPDGMIVVEHDTPAVYEAIAEQLKTVGFINIVRGNMEFGPRALCNTTTLARADDRAVVEEINRINGRDTVMPFAPVVSAHEWLRYFPDASRLHRSAEFMICAVQYAPGLGEQVPGAALRTVKGLYTGRPQVYSSKYEWDSVTRILDDYGLLINTSFNVHGVPICLDLKHVVHSHQFQRERNPNVRTIVIAN